ncbi:lipoxygenase homology domain-containing protein 1-like isoform X2 [Dreissena polymorpha]|uniref:lipoxygenase homology domain-containing protein 1-like isoform X2 n=1 Tax=Dreissena polymorpha TaxID=45954 RepID=UPI00226472D1|nr:lipoxygenase homology domain-containing protein 1-like isoform X2 [Dreissena polymorpha]
MALNCVGSWHIRPTPSFVEGRADLKKTWAGPISTEMYSKGLLDLCDRTQDNLTRICLQMKKLDPCTEYGLQHWHPNKRPQSAVVNTPKPDHGLGKWQSLDVMFTDTNTMKLLSEPTSTDGGDSYVDPPARNTFCNLCSTMDEHRVHMLKHTTKKKFKGRRKIEYIAPPPRVRHSSLSEEKEIPIRERLYKVEVFTSDVCNAGTDAKVFVSMKGTLSYLSRTQLKKNQGSSSFCFVRASKEVFFIKGPFLGNIQILTIEHEGIKKSQAWHLEKVLVTDMKALKTWLFKWGDWLSIFMKPHYSNKVDLQAVEVEHQPTEYTIEVHTGKHRMAGTDSHIFITLFGNLGTSKKIHLKDNTSDKKLFERNSVDKFVFHMNGIGELKKIRIEHDGKGMASGWFLDKVVIQDSEHPKDLYFFTYGGWIAKDEGDGKLWREISAKKKLPKELQTAVIPGNIHEGTDTRYMITTKTGDVRFAGTDANVFIQMVGQKGMTPKLTLDNPKNNFERGMTDNFELKAVNVGQIKHIIIGHDNSNPGAGWFLEKVTVRRYIPKDEARERLHAMKKQLKQKKNKSDGKDQQKKSKKNTHADENDSTDDDEDDGRTAEKKKKDLKTKQNKSENVYTVSSSSSSEDSSDSDEESKLSKRPKSAIRKQASYKGPGSVLSSAAKQKKHRDEEKEEEEEETDDDDDGKYSSQEKRRLRPRSARPDGRRSYDQERKDFTDAVSVSNRSKSNQRGRSASHDRDAVMTDTGKRRVSTSASSLRKVGGQRGDDKHDDEAMSELKVPLYEECMFHCNKWLADNEDDGLVVRELEATALTTYYKEH